MQGGGGYLDITTRVLTLAKYLYQAFEIFSMHSKIRGWIWSEKSSKIMSALSSVDLIISKCNIFIHTYQTFLSSWVYTLIWNISAYKTYILYHTFELVFCYVKSCLCITTHYYYYPVSYLHLLYD